MTLHIVIHSSVNSTKYYSQCDDGCVLVLGKMPVGAGAGKCGDCFSYMVSDFRTMLVETH